MDPLTSTPRFVGRIDSFLTEPSAAPPATVALDYLRRNGPALGLAGGLPSLDLRRDYVDIGGTHHLSWTQTANGIPLFGNGVRANVTADGRLVNLAGSPVAGLATPATPPVLDRRAALTAATADARMAMRPNGATGAASVSFDEEEAAQVLFQTVSGPRLAWRTTIVADIDAFVSVVDAADGSILYRQSLVSHAEGQAFDNYPNAPHGGQPHPVDFTGKGWLPPGATRLRGNNAHAYSDVNDDDVPEADEETGPDSTGNWNYGPIATFNGQPYGCSETYVCTWVSNLQTGNFSWEANRKQNTTQLFHLVNTFHDHLAALPIGFTEAAGNFQQVNASGQGVGGDAVRAEGLDGADTLRVDGALVGLPDERHVNNANMFTPPDGQAPRMQMYLSHDPARPDAPGVAANSGDDADIVYHEYTHGLSNRLVVDAQGFSTLTGFQSRAMGEAWSDWYAFDYQVAHGLDIDTPAHGELLEGDYSSHATPEGTIRRQAIDCPVGSSSARCRGGTLPDSGAGPGGFTYGDFGRVKRYPQVHADGEIWAETLWDLRTALGSPVTEGLVTRAMELSPANPSFLDERNAILQADLIGFGAAHHERVWQVFANRGMGWFAATLDGDDVEPVEDFHLPPPPGTPFGKLIGKVVDQDSGRPVPGIRIAFGGHSSGYPGDIAGLTKENGAYDLKRIQAGTYPKVTATGQGYDRAAVPLVTIAAGGATMLDWKVRRDWASIFGGASIASLTGPDYTEYGCGPEGAIDQSLRRPWSSNSVDEVGRHITPAIVIKLPQTIDVVEFAVDPTAGCGDDYTASTGHYRVETSSDGSTWTVASEGAFGFEDVEHLNVVRPAAGAAGVRYVRVTMLSQLLVADCGDIPFQAGCAFADLTEFEVYGRPAT